MDFKNLRDLADKNEVRIDDHNGHSRNPPHYYLLQEAFLFYFNTFIAKKESFDFYASATSTDKRKALEILEHQFLDIENTVFCPTRYITLLIPASLPPLISNGEIYDRPDRHS